MRIEKSSLGLCHELNAQSFREGKTKGREVAQLRWGELKVGEKSALYLGTQARNKVGGGKHESRSSNVQKTLQNCQEERGEEIHVPRVALF